MISTAFGRLLSFSTRTNSLWAGWKGQTRTMRTFGLGIALVLLVAGCALGGESDEPYVQQVNPTRLQLPQWDPYLIFASSGDVDISERLAARLEPPSAELFVEHMDGQLSGEFEACETRDSDDLSDACKRNTVSIYVHLMAAACDPAELDDLKLFWTMFEANFDAIAPRMNASEDEKSDWRKGNVLKIEAFTNQLCPSRSQRTAELGMWISENYS